MYNFTPIAHGDEFADVLSDQRTLFQPEVKPTVGKGEGAFLGGNRQLEVGSHNMLDSGNPVHPLQSDCSALQMSRQGPPYQNTLERSSVGRRGGVVLRVMRR